MLKADEIAMNKSGLPDFHEGLQTLKFKLFFAGFKAESIAFWLLCLYILEEYIRPQNMYPAINIIPWGQFSILACFLSVFLTRNRALSVNALDKMFVVFTGIVILSVVFAWNPGASLKNWTTYTSWILMYFCIVSILTTPNRMLLFVLFFVLINFKMSQHGARTFAMRGFTFARYGLVGAPGWFFNSGELTLEMVVLFSISISVLLAFRNYISKFRWWVLMALFPGTAVLTIIGASSRGGQIALVAVLLALMLRGKYIIKKIVILLALVFLVTHFLPHQQMERFTTMGDDKTSDLRLEHWKAAIDVIEHHPLGIGYDNWIPYYEKYYHPRVLEQIHNTFLQAFVDLGYPGGILFILMLVTAFIMNYRSITDTKRFDNRESISLSAVALGLNLSLLGSIIAAFFMSVLYYPVFWLAFALTSALRNIVKYNSNPSIEMRQVRDVYNRAN